MSNNLLELINEYLTKDVVTKLAQFLGESPQNTATAVSSAVPSIIAGLVNKSSDSLGLTSIQNILKQHNFEGTVGNLLEEFTGNESISNILRVGSGLLGTVFGNKAEGVANLLSANTGIGKSSATSLFGLLMPVVLGVLSKSLRSNGLSIQNGLAGFLSNQTGFLKSFLPVGFASLIGSASSAKAAPRPIPDDPSHNDGKTWTWVLGSLLLASALGLWNHFNTKAVKPVETVTHAVTNTVSDFFEKTLSSGYAIKASKDGVENKLIGFLEDSGKAVDKDLWFNMNGILFETGNANLLPDSKPQVANIAEILKAFPNVKIKIGGYTDNTGNASTNLALSNDRATTVRKAIVAAGIDASRIESEGFGSEFPVASNDTEAGRQQNRRIDVRVTAK